MFKFLIRQARRTWGIVLLLVVQFAVGFTFFGLTFDTIGTASVTLQTIEHIYGNEGYFYLSDRTGDDRMFSLFEQEDINIRFGEMIRWLRENPDFAFYSVAEYPLLTNEELLAPAGALLSYSPSRGMYEWHALRFDRNYLRQFPLSIDEGRTFTDEDFIATDTMPVILGANFRSCYALGDTLSCDVQTALMESSVKARVIGFLEKGSYLAAPRSLDGLLAGDDVILYPYFDLDESSFTGEYTMMIEQSIIRPTSYDSACMAIKQKSLELDLLDWEPSPLQSQTAMYARKAQTARNLYILIGVIVTIYALVSTINSALQRVTSCYREWGIFMLCGARRGYLILSLLVEYATYMILAYIFAILALLCLGIHHIYYGYIIGLAVFSLCCIIVLPCFYLRRVSISTVLRRVE